MNKLCGPAGPTKFMEIILVYRVNIESGVVTQIFVILFLYPVIVGCRCVLEMTWIFYFLFLYTVYCSTNVCRLPATNQKPRKSSSLILYSLVYKKCNCTKPMRWLGLVSQSNAAGSVGEGRIVLCGRIFLCGRIVLCGCAEGGT